MPGGAFCAKLNLSLTLCWCKPARPTQGSQKNNAPPSPSLSLSHSLALLSCHSEIFGLVAKMIVVIPCPSLLLRVARRVCCCAARCLWALKDIQNNHKSGRIKKTPTATAAQEHILLNSNAFFMGIKKKQATEYLSDIDESLYDIHIKANFFFLLFTNTFSRSVLIIFYIINKGCSTCSN